jgi:hypothetical protein
MKEKPWHMEGKSNKEWMILDYITVVAHMYSAKTADSFTPWKNCGAMPKSPKLKIKRT